MIGIASRHVSPTAMIELAVSHVPKLIVSVAQLRCISAETVLWYEGFPRVHALCHPRPHGPGLVLHRNRIHVLVGPYIVGRNM